MSGKSSRRLAGVLVGVGALVTSIAVAPQGIAADEAAAAFTVYLAPTDAGGSDDNDGLTPQTAVNTLPRAHDILTATRPTTDVEVRIKQGTYVAPPFHEWRFYVPGHSVSFMPIDYDPGDDVGDIAGLPVFRNAKCGADYCTGIWLQPRLPTDPADPLYNGGDSNLAFIYLQIERYSSGGLSIFGNSERDWDDENFDPPLHIRPTKGLNKNRVFGMQFRNLGNKWSGGKPGYGGIVLTNSSNNQVTNSHFVNLENSDSPGMIHGLYVTHDSSANTITNNKFSHISGYPVKFRNRSNDNRVEENVIERAGRGSYYRGEFCDIPCAEQNSISQQCASWRNRFFYNRLRGNYAGDQPSLWSLSPEGLQTPGGPGCPPAPPDTQRVYTGGNIRE